MGLQGQLNDVSSDSIPILFLALIATSFNHLLSFFSHFCHSLGFSRFQHPRLPSPTHDDDFEFNFSGLGSGLSSLIVLSEQLNLNTRDSHPHRRLSSCGGEDEGCVVCLNGFEDGEFIRRLSCNHVFHKDCLDRWIDQMKFSCPLCRSPLVSDCCGDRERLDRRVAGQLAAWFPAVR